MSVNLDGLLLVHPGEILRNDVLPALGVSKVRIAKALRISRTTLYAIIRCEQAITADLALRIAKLTGTTAEMWMNLQHSHDLKLARERLASVLDGIPRLDV